MQLNRQQAGVALMEALVALVVLGIGVLGLLWTYQQALIQQRHQLMYGIAMNLADDLVERMSINASQQAIYAKTWGNTSTPTSDCAAQACSRQDLALWDLQQIQEALQNQLPQGDMAVFTLTDVAGWWGIVIAWHDTSETYRTNTHAGTPPCPTSMSCWRLFFRPTR